MTGIPGSKCSVHGTCVALAGRGVLLRGGPGAGKSDLALRFLSRFGGEGAELVSDDQVVLTSDGSHLVATAPDAIRGKLEVRGVGIVPVASADEVPLVLVVDLVPSSDVPRLPDNPLPRETILGVAVPVAVLDPFEISAAEKLKLLVTGRL